MARIISIEKFVNSRNPKQRGNNYYQLMYGEDFGGMITPEVKIHGEVFLPITSWATGKCILTDVKIPYNMSIISLSVTDAHTDVGKIGDYTLEKGFRIRRGIYVDGLICKDDHINQNAKVVIGYDLRIYGRQHLTIEKYRKTQKQKNKLK